MPASKSFVVTCARGTEDLLRDELEELGVDSTEQSGFVEAQGGIPAAYRVLLGSRIAQRVLWPLASFEASDADETYRRLSTFGWHEHMEISDTFAVRSAVAHTSRIHARYLTQRVKDALVDAFRRTHDGLRPSVDREAPEVLFHVHFGASVSLSLDLGGRALHQRGYRPKGAAAPLKETLAAAIVRASGWKSTEPFVDPMCGSGTLVVEAAMVALAVPPGARVVLGQWKGHDHERFAALKNELELSRRSAASRPIVILGRDTDPAALQLTQESLRRAGIDHSGIVLERGGVRGARPPGPLGHLIVNPPYGERLGSHGDALRAHVDLGDALRHFPGWRAHVLAGEPRLLKQLGLKSAERRTLYNGPIRCTLATFAIASEMRPSRPRKRPESSMFANRLKKNLRRLGPWAKRHHLDAYRAYDGEIPEYNLAVDRYGDSAIVQEHHRPRSVDPTVADARLRDAMLVVGEVLQLEPSAVHLRVRARGADQYERRAHTEERRIVQEGAHRFEVNLLDYLDTGLFLDHRLLRQRVAESLSHGSRLLNLFAYTCTASVYGAAAGAHVTSVDLSKKYLMWGEDNFRRNAISPEDHAFEVGDVRQFLRRSRDSFDTILLAPPSYSRSSRADVFDLRVHHPELIDRCLERLAPRGALFFSTHARDFQLHPSMSKYSPRDVTEAMTPRDFRSRPHRTWELRR